MESSVASGADPAEMAESAVSIVEQFDVAEHISASQIMHFVDTLFIGALFLATKQKRPLKGALLLFGGQGRNRTTDTRIFNIQVRTYPNDGFISK